VHLQGGRSSVASAPAAAQIMPDDQKQRILKDEAGSASGRRAKWDEDNLTLNEQIKAELAPTKIEEPKTPYHAPMDPDAVVLCSNA
jgi:hypothetical protein